MKKILVRAGQIFGMMLVATSASAYRAPFFAEIDTVTGLDSTQSSLANVIYMNLTFKVNDTWTIIPDFRNDIIYKTAGVSETKFVHQYVRVLAAQKTGVAFGAFKLSLDYRYKLPTDTAQQVQGSYGSFLFRPHLDGDMGNFSLHLYNYFAFNLQRNGEALNQPRFGAQPPSVANPIFTDVVEIIPVYKFGSSGLSISDDFSLVFARSASVESNKDANKWDYALEHELEVDFQRADFLANTSLGLSLDQKMDINPGVKKEFTKANSTVNFKVAREF